VTESPASIAARKERLKKEGFFSREIELKRAMSLLPDHFAHFRPQSFYTLKDRASGEQIDYIPNHKSGGTYLESRLEIIGHGEKFRMRASDGEIYKARIAHIDTTPVIDPDCRWNTSKKMIIIRDPFERIISSYQHMLRAPFREQTGTLSHHLTVRMDFFKKIFNPIFDEENGLSIEPKNISTPPPPIDIVESFALFLYEVAQYGFYNRHLFPQLSFIRDVGLFLEDIEYVIMHEDLRQGVEKIGELHNFSLEPHETANQNASNRYVKRVLLPVIKESTDLRELFSYLYAPDIELYQRAKDGNHFYS